MARRKKVNIFAELKEALEDALAYERGETVNIRVTEIPAPPRKMSPAKIRKIRRKVE